MNKLTKRLSIAALVTAIGAASFLIPPKPKNNEYVLTIRPGGEIAYSEYGVVDSVGISKKIGDVVSYDNLRPTFGYYAISNANGIKVFEIFRYHNSITNVQKGRGFTVNLVRDMKYTSLKRTNATPEQLKMFHDADTDLADKLNKLTKENPKYDGRDLQVWGRNWPLM